MAKYRAVETSFVDNKLVNAGEIVDYNPPEGTTISENLELIEDKPAKAKADAKSDPALA